MHSEHCGVSIGNQSWGAFHQAFCQCFSLTNFISYWNPCIWLAESKLVSENHWQNAWWNAPLILILVSAYIHVFTLYSVSVSSIPNLSISKNEIIKLISGNDSINISLSCGTLFINFSVTSYRSTINFGYTCQNCFSPSWCSLHCMMTFVQSFYEQFSQRVHTALCIMRKEWHLIKSYSGVNVFSLKFLRHIIHNAACMHFCCQSSGKIMSMNIMQLKLHKLKTWTKAILTCFTKLIAEQSSVIEYESEA